MRLAPTDDGLDEDVRSLDDYYQLGAPKPPQNPLARLMASAQGAVLLTGSRTDAERLKYVRLKARRARELRHLLHAT